MQKRVVPCMRVVMLQPIEIERNDLGYSLNKVREGRHLRVIHRECTDSSTCIFLIHGAGGRAGQFKHLIKALEGKVNVVAFDFLGHGDSPSPNQPELYTIEEHLRDLLFIYNKYRCTQNVLVGHSYGGIHTLRLVKALGDQQRARELVGVVIIALGDRCLPWTVFVHLPAFVLELLRPLARASSNAALFTPSSDPALVAFENAISCHNRMYMMKVILSDTSNQELWDSCISAGARVLVSAGIPRVLIGGEGDILFPPDRVAALQQLLEVPDESCHVIKEAGHLIMLEQPDKVLDILSNFIRS